jgi:hypothetical protein
MIWEEEPHTKLQHHKVVGYSLTGGNLKGRYVGRYNETNNKGIIIWHSCGTNSL